jgi:hypothetical protein
MDEDPFMINNLQTKIYKISIFLNFSLKNAATPYNPQTGKSILNIFLPTVDFSA